MTRAEITRALDEEIERLHQVKRLLQGSGDLTPALKNLVNHKNGRPARVISEEGRRRIAEAQKRRWALAKREQ